MSSGSNAIAFGIVLCSRSSLNMLILFDHVTPGGIARFLPGHTVTNAKDREWDTVTNGDLLSEAERAGFDVLLTADKNLFVRWHSSRI